ncbi:MAG: aldolase/citrate lyase family protein [Dehalococcoidia bacterium]|nr:aldolase/citrate lyase family protein [Dehalococcoidia bacterium]
MNSTVRRSWLITPAHDQQRLDQAAKSGADVVVLDLEDTVHDSRKHVARENVQDAIRLMRSAGSEVFVRCDPELLYADMAASVWRGLSGVILPGLTGAEQVREADDILSRFESERGVVRPPPVGEVREADDPRGPEQALEIHISLDTGPANWHAEELIRASDRVSSISLGRADLKMDLREEPSGDLHLLPYLIQRLIVIANALEVEPVGAWWKATSRGLSANYEDTLQAAFTGRLAGFRGALCMRTEQVGALNTGFTPSEDDVRSARAVQNSSPAHTPAAVIAANTVRWYDACTSRDRAGSLVRNAEANADD